MFRLGSNPIESGREVHRGQQLTGEASPIHPAAQAILRAAGTPRVSAQVSTNRIIVRANLPAGTVYRVKLVSARIASADGHAQLDGDFTGAFPSGNGIAGGNFEFQTRNDSSNRPLSRWSTSAGTFNVRFFRDAATLTFNNFRNYMNNANNFPIQATA